MSDETRRRPLALRSASWSKALAYTIKNIGFTPNQISLLSVVFAVLGGSFYLMAEKTSGLQQCGCFVGAAICIQIRLLCNMLDGMIAMEGTGSSKLGVIFNELPDRISDTLFLVLAGHAAKAGELGIELGWAASLLAALTAYIRAFGANLGLQQDFAGPMAKQQRMAVLTVISVLAATGVFFNRSAIAMTIGLQIIVVGTLITCLRRTCHIVEALQGRPI